MFGALYAADGTDPDALVAVARACTPRIEVCGPREIALDLGGLSRLFGDARAIGERLRSTAADRGLRVRVAIAGTRTAARLLVRHRAGITVVPPGGEAAAVAGLPVALLEAVAAAGTTADGGGASRPRSRAAAAPGETFRRWGLRTLGDVAALPPDAVAARLGACGAEWQRLARGEDARPLVPAAPEERFEQALNLDWPIEGLEPLSFVLGRLLEPLAAHLARRDRGAAVLRVRLALVRIDERTPAEHARSLQLPAPMRDARTLRTLALLDLESHPPPAPVTRVIVAADPTPARVGQDSLLVRPLPAPEQVSTLLARLTALMGAGRCGSPVPVDSWQPGAFAMQPFAPQEARPSRSPEPGAAATAPAVALRRFRFPIPARVRVEDGRPARVATDRRGLSGGRVDACAGPWRTSGRWWERPGAAWDRDEWDVALSDGATYRLFRDRDTDRWFVEGVVD